MSSFCMVCFEETPSLLPSLPTTKCCSVLVCRTCLKRWFETCQQKGHPLPVCPGCRRSASLVEARSVLGYPYRTHSATKTLGNIDEDYELTRDFLSIHAKQCSSCGVWIMKNGGCDSMTCRCGHRFLWSMPHVALSTRNLRNTHVARPHFSVQVLRLVSSVLRSVRRVALVFASTMIYATMRAVMLTQISQVARALVRITLTRLFPPPPSIPFWRLYQQHTHRGTYHSQEPRTWYFFRVTARAPDGEWLESSVADWQLHLGDVPVKKIRAGLVSSNANEKSTALSSFTGSSGFAKLVAWIKAIDTNKNLCEKQADLVSTDTALAAMMAPPERAPLRYRAGPQGRVSRGLLGPKAESAESKPQFTVFAPNPM